MHLELVQTKTISLLARMIELLKFGMHLTFDIISHYLDTKEEFGMRLFTTFKK